MQPIADMSDDDPAFSEAAESEDSSPSEIEATAEELDRWERLGSPSTARAEDVPGQQTRDVVGSTSTASQHSQEVRGPGHIDPTAGLPPADRRYLQGIPSMASFLRMVESHNWEAIPDAAFTLTCAGLLRECLQAEGNNRDDIHAFAGEMLAQAQQQPTTAQPLTEPPASSSTRSRSRTPARHTGGDDAQTLSQALGVSQDDALPLILEQPGHQSLVSTGSCRFMTPSFTWHAISCAGFVDLRARAFSPFYKLSCERFLRWRAKGYVRRLPTKSMCIRTRNNRRRRRGACRMMLQPFHAILPHFTAGAYGALHTCRSLILETASLTQMLLTSRSRTRSGPKSGGAGLHRQRQPRAGFRFLIFMNMLQASSGVRVPALSGGAGGVANFASTVPDFGTKLTGVQGAKLPNRAGKRAYNRACRRAQLWGFTKYRGRILTAQDLRGTSRAQAPIRASVPRAPHATRHRIRVLSWNAGGMGTVQDALLDWIQRANYDMVFIQETKWKFSNTWSDARFHYIHSGGSSPEQKHGGVLTVISQRLTEAASIRYKEHAIGRLLQVQFAVRGQTDCHINSFNIYQHAWTKAPQVMSRRKHIWESLAAGLDVVPMRHSLIVAGDFNSTCQTNRWVCGHNVLVPQDLPADNEDFCNLLEAYGLTACNTWMRRHGAATFQFGKIQSQLDYILLRRSHADATSRQATTIQDFEVDAHRDGARHFPVHTSFSIRWRPWRHDASRAPRIDQVQMANDAVHDKLGRVDNLCQDVQHALALRSDTSLSNVDDILQAACIKHFPAHNGSLKGSVWQDDLMQWRASRMWQHFRQMRACEQTRAGIFKAWRHWSKLMYSHSGARIGHCEALPHPTQPCILHPQATSHW